MKTDVSLQGGPALTALRQVLPTEVQHGSGQWTATINTALLGMLGGQNLRFQAVYNDGTVHLSRSTKIQF